MAGRRLLVFIVLLLVVAAGASAIAPRGREGDFVRPTVPAQPPPGPAAKVVEAALPRDRRVRARVGDVVDLAVSHGTEDEVQIPALGLAEPVEPGIAAQFEFDADHPGRFAVTLRDAATRVGVVEVRPAG
jgi:hypothetical protein